MLVDDTTSFNFLIFTSGGSISPGMWGQGRVRKERLGLQPAGVTKTWVVKAREAATLRDMVVDAGKFV